MSWAFRKKKISNHTKSTNSTGVNATLPFLMRFINPSVLIQKKGSRLIIVTFDQSEVTFDFFAKRGIYKKLVAIQVGAKIFGEDYVKEFLEEK